MKRFLLLALGAFAVAWAQPSGVQPDSVAALREVLDGGYYALAAQVDGPQVIAAHPNSAEAHLLYARALYLADNLAGSAAQLARARALNPTPELKRNLKHLDALVLAAQGNTDKATRLLAQVFAAAPGYKVAMDWGQVAWAGGNLKMALRAYHAAATTKQGATQPWPSLNAARLQLQQGQFKAAIHSLETTLTILERDLSPRPSPAYTEAFYRLGQAYEALGEPKTAISNYQAAYNADPDYTPAEEALARLEQP